MADLNYHRGNGLPIVDVTVRYHALNGVPHPSGRIPQTVVRALIDTGATNIVLQPHIVHQLGLPFAANIDNTVVGGAIHQVPGHAADLIFGTTLTNTVTGVLVLSQALSGYDMIVGWDALRFTDWTFNRNGTFSQSW
jgi:predicted aspartyl protease